VVVGQSVTAHQAHDKRYYKRFNFESVAMEDYEIRQILHRRQKPAYSVDLISSSTRDGINFRLVVENRSEIFAEKVSAILLAPEPLVVNPNRMAYGPETIGTISYLGLPGQQTRSVSPFTKMPIPIQSFSIRQLQADEDIRFVVFVRIYDEYGQALEATFTIISATGQNLPGEVLEREKILY
jgi:hypothetical protein